MARTRGTLQDVGVGLLLPAAIVLVATVPWLVAWSDLPDPVATHWGLTGDPDGHTSPALALALVVVPAVAAALVLAAVATHVRGSRAKGPVPAGPALAGAFAAGLGALFAVLSLGVVVANAGAASWQDAELPLVWALASVVALIAAGWGAAIALGPIRLGAPDAPDALAGTGPQAAGLALRPGERAGWVGTGHARWPLAIAAALAVAAIVAAVLTALWVAAICALAGLSILLLGEVHVTAGVQGVRVSSPVGWPRVTLPLEEIESARAIELRPVDWGGWGYRGSLHLAGRAAWVLRRGEALELRLTDSRAFAVTVDGAADAAAVVNALLARSTQPS
ncbi:MAG TPA: DUF1648 domain-containing protein [Acidimicrobiales bacterium]|jgi:hypothetical protein